MSVAILQAAIQDRRQVAFYYAGHQRTIIPMALGTNRLGEWQLRAEQVSGGSSSGTIQAEVPKLWKLANMSDVTLLDMMFQIPRQYQRGDSSMAHIEAQL